MNLCKCEFRSGRGWDVRLSAFILNVLRMLKAFSVLLENSMKQQGGGKSGLFRIEHPEIIRGIKGEILL